MVDQRGNFNSPRIKSDSKSPYNSQQGGNHGNNRGGGYSDSEYSLPKGYLEGGYFIVKDENGKKVTKLKPELVLEVAESISKSISNVKPDLKSTQLRKFYDYCRNISEKMRLLDNDYDRVEADIKKLKSFAADAKNKGKIPKLFYDFIDINVSNIYNAHDFNKGFMEHFQAMVAYYPKKN